MNVLAHFVHCLDPVFVDWGPVQFWYYGLAYAVGFLGVLIWLRARRGRVGMTLEQAYDLTLLLIVCVLLFGRGFSVLVYQWDYYGNHPTEIVSYWRGGMASHGVLIGAAVAIALFCRLQKSTFFQIADELVVPGAFFLALGRIGNFINGLIYGSVTDVWWAVQFPGTNELRHPVTLYEAIKNFALIAILLYVARRHPSGRGMLSAHFVFWYGFLRIFTDLFRDYATTFLGIGPGQYANALMAVIGVGMMWWCRRAPTLPATTETETNSHITAAAGARSVRHGKVHVTAAVLRRIALAGLLVFSLTIPSGWSRDALEELREGASPRPARLESTLNHLRCKEAAEQGGARYGLVLFPWLFQLEEYPLKDVHAQMRAFASQLDVPYLDLLAAFEGRAGDDLCVSPVNEHPSPMAHRIAAQRLAQFLREDMFPSLPGAEDGSETVPRKRQD
ncbi:MAG: prolipoprotein diacylglyceryl transferase [Phycisphaerales bacterium]|nr:MAG: prolipoprotein diacylglyceryl transferase [Phycisphaerales bacterium]